MKRTGSSPPSPVFDLPPRRFIAIASVSCDSREIDPSDIAPVAKRLTISFAGSTSSMSIGSTALVLNFISPRSVARREASSLTSAAYSLYFSAPLPFARTECCSSAIVSGFHMWCSPSRRQA